MRFSRFEPKGRLKQQIRFQTTFLLTNRHSHQIKATRRHTHIGSTAGKTTIRSGGDTSLKGAQIIGKGIGLDAQSLRIRSVQDTETYQGKQQNGNVQVTLGYGLSASGSYSQSKIRADHASVTGQSGIYAGEDGYQIKVGDNTDLKGGIITSGKSAEDKGKNLFQTATLTHSDIQNHSRYEGKSFGIGASVAISGESMGQNRPADSGPGIRLIDVSKSQNNNNAIGYGSDGDSKNSTTRSGINTRNIHITDEAGQLGCAAGGLIATAGMAGGYTQASEGSRQLFGTYQSDFGKKVVLSLGTPIEYESPLVSDAKNLAIWGLETLITRKLGKITNPSTPKNPHIKQINDLSQELSFKSSGLINNQKVELTQQQVLSNGKILPAGTIAKLDKNGVVATFPDGKTVTYAGVTEQKALPKPDKLATSERVKKNIQETRKGNATSNFNQHAQIEKEIKKLSRGPSGLIGKEFEDWLVKFHGGNGSFKMGGREFDGAITINRWYEAKSGNFW